jgi:hypothetical protein
MGALDKSLTGLSPQAQAETIEAGVTELRACAELCGKSERPADHEQLEGLNKALALLAPAEEAFVAPVAADLVLGPAVEAPAATARKTGQTGVVPVARKRRSAKAPALDFQAAGVLLDGFEAKLGTLAVVLSDPLSRLAQLDRALAELQEQVRAIKWLGRERVPEILRVADVAKSVEDRLAAGAALVHLGEARGAEMMMGILGKAAADKQPLPDTSAALLRSLTDASLLDWLLKLFLKPAHPAVCGLLLPLLVERNLLSSEQLLELANHPKDEVAVEAARALPWTDGEPDTQRLLAWAQQARTAKRAHALLFAATALGSQAALAEVRARVGKGEQADDLLVDALAIAGAPSDAAALLALAERPEQDAAYVLLAAANLGSADTAKAATALAELLPDEVVEEVRRMLAGGEPNAANRTLRGQPWSVAGLIACLGEPGETLLSRRLMALELRARTGQAPLSTLPLLLPADARPELLANWSTYYAKANGRLKPGDWYYQGKVMASQ